jgi:glycosyltransferase involved in cell wall biosynthesis
LNFDVILGQSSAALGLIKHVPKINTPVVSIYHGTIIGEFLTRIQNIQGIKDLARVGIDAVYVLYNFFGRQREFVTHSKKVIAVSNFVKESLLNETYVESENVGVIYNGVDPEKFLQKLEISLPSNKGSNPEKSKLVRLVYVGQIYKSKGLADLLLAVKKVIDNQSDFNLSLDLFGDGNYVAELKNQISELTLSKIVNMRGKVPYSEILKSLSNYDIFVIPSRRKEGFPMTIVEAMFSGLPVIGANIGGIPEAIENESSGLLYESGNIDELSLAITRLLVDSGLRKQMGQNARKIAHERFTLDIMLDKYERVLKEVKK